MLKPGLYLVVNVFKPTATKSFQLLSLICRERERQEMNPALASSRGDLPTRRRSDGPTTANGAGESGPAWPLVRPFAVSECQEAAQQSFVDADC